MITFESQIDQHEKLLDHESPKYNPELFELLMAVYLNHMEAGK